MRATLKRLSVASFSMSDDATRSMMSNCPDFRFASRTVESTIGV
jgi:hypothetical protein